MDKRKCNNCREEKPLTEEFFYKHKTTKTGFHTQCITCVKAKQIAWRNDPANREDCRLRAAKHWHNKSHKERSRICNERRLMQRFKRTPQWYEDTLKEQGGHCALCPTVPNGRRLQVDHDHSCCPCKTTRYTCGECVRGLLCIDCNARLGYLEELLKEATMVVPKWDTWLEDALLYLTKYGCR